MYVNKRGQAVNSDIEGLLAIKKKAKKIKNSLSSNRGGPRNNNQRKSNLLAPSPPLTNFKGQKNLAGEKKKPEQQNSSKQHVV